MTISAENHTKREAAAGTKAGVGEPNWLAAYRQTAFDRFTDLGFPTRSLESWRFTDTSTLASAPMGRPVTDHGPESGPLPGLGAGPRLVFVDGRFAPAHSDCQNLPAGVWAGPLSAALVERPEIARLAFDQADHAGRQAFAALNGACFTDGFVLALADGAICSTPIEIIHWSRGDGGAICHLRHLIVLGAGARAELAETYAGVGAGWTNTVTRLEIGAGAVLRHLRVQREAAEATHVMNLGATLAADSRYDSFTLSLGARLSRHDIALDLRGERAAVGLHGAYLLRDRQEASFVSTIDHRAANGTTAETFRGVIEDQAHGVFLGAIRVHPGADGTDAQQQSKALLLGAEASVDTKPELSIAADDVQCRHGATVGDLDEAALFYLAARGLPPAEARRLLIAAFIDDVIETAGLPDRLTTAARRQAQAWLGGSEEGLSS